MEKEERKIKLFYSGELLFIALVFLVLGFLELFKVMKLSERAQLIFKIITLVGATWLFIDFFWTFFSPKKRAKNCLMDKIMVLPLAVYLYVFDILGFIIKPNYGYYQIGVPIAFMYAACAYIFQAIYHYYKPVPMVIEMIEEAKKPKEEPPVVEENKEEEK